MSARVSVRAWELASVSDSVLASDLVSETALATVLAKVSAKAQGTVTVPMEWSRKRRTRHMQ